MDIRVAFIKEHNVVGGSSYLPGHLDIFSIGVAQELFSAGVAVPYSDFRQTMIDEAPASEETPVEESLEADESVVSDEAPASEETSAPAPKGRGGRGK